MGGWVEWIDQLRLNYFLLGRFGAARACWCLGNAYTEMEEHKKAYLFACKHLELSMQVCVCVGGGGGGALLFHVTHSALLKLLSWSLVSAAQ